jgi:2'-hydroxyisoflavone reductase
MSINRRRFIQSSAAGALGLGLTPGSALGLSGPPGRVGELAGRPATRAAEPLRILILGGTGFIGPYQVHYAVARGHRVTVFNRGRTQADLPAGVEHLVGDRTSDLSALEGRDWDVVIDNPTTLPKWVADVGRVLQGRTRHYVFISSVSVYADNSVAGMDEDTPVIPYEGDEDPMTITRVTGSLYGALKALSEQQAEVWFPGHATIVRPGLIVGPGDPSGRFTYWPVRIERGGEVLAPGDGTDPVQIIDARDLSEWIIRLVEQNDVGAYNAVGPVSELNMAEMLYGIRAAVSGSTPVRFTWVDSEFLAAREVRPWQHMPVWVPEGPDNAGWSRVGIDRAVATGLTFRPLAVTTADTLAWWHGLTEEERSAPSSFGITAEREAEVLGDWRAARA